ncbi:hypothetical protein EDB84DRAFT_958566 [Lactarius hengduanensis]|nr:hypothetical protein EDB84DRAFT_958566 [Lactarius hengduanensis]
MTAFQMCVVKGLGGGPENEKLPFLVLWSLVLRFAYSFRPSLKQPWTKVKLSQLHVSENSNHRGVAVQSYTRMSVSLV